MAKMVQQPHRATKQSQKRGKVLILVIGGLVLVVIAVRMFFMPGEGAYKMPTSTIEGSPAQTIREDGLISFLNPDSKEIATIRAEIADDNASHARGLMGRTRMDEQQGMLFIFDYAEERSFWMANTPLPLDIIFIGADKSIVKIHQNTTPYSEQSLESGAPAQYVVEVNAGFCARNGVTEGCSISFLRTDTK